MKRTTSATFSIDRKEVQVALLQIHGGDGTYLLVSLIEVSSVHFCLICSVRFSRFSFFSRTPQKMGKKNGFSCANLSIPMHFSSFKPIFELRITIYWISLEAIVNSFVISF